MKRAALITVPIALLLLLWVFRGPTEPGDAPPDAPPESGPEEPESEQVPAMPPDEPLDETAPRAADRAWTLHLLVQDEAGAPVEGARIWFPGRHSLPEKTGADGRADLELSGSGDLTVYRREHAPVCLEGCVPPESGEMSRVVTLPVGEEISGVVLDHEGEPVDRKSLALLTAHPTGPALWNTDPNAMWFQARTGPDGRFGFRHLPPGEYRIVVRVVVNSDLKPPGEASRAHTGEREVTVRLEQALSVALRLVDDATGEPVLEQCTVTVIYHPHGAENPHGAETRNFGRHDGLLTLDRVRARSPKLRVSAQGYETSPEISAAAVPGSPQPIVVRLKRGGSRLLLTVTDGTGAAIEEIRLTRVLDLDGRDFEMWEHYDSPEGRYEIALSPGRHRLRVEDDHLQLAPLWFEIDAKEGEQTARKVALPRAGGLRVPAADLVAKATGKGDLPPRTVTVCDEEGDPILFEYGRKTGTGDLEFPRLHPGVVIVKWTGRDGKPAEKRVTVVAGETTEVRLD